MWPSEYRIRNGFEPTVLGGHGKNQSVESRKMNLARTVDARGARLSWTDGIRDELGAVPSGVRFSKKGMQDWITGGGKGGKGKNKVFVRCSGVLS